MKKLLIIVALALPLGGCFDVPAFVSDVFKVSTATVANPVTPTMLNDAENGAIIVFAGLRAYKRSCVAGAVPLSCKGIIRQIQVYTRQLPPLLDGLRDFVDKGDQLNAVTSYNAVRALLGTVENVATQNGIALGAK